MVAAVVMAAVVVAAVVAPWRAASAAAVGCADGTEAASVRQRSAPDPWTWALLTVARHYRAALPDQPGPVRARALQDMLPSLDGFCQTICIPSER